MPSLGTLVSRPRSPHVLMLVLALYLTGLYSIAREYKRPEAGPIGLAALLSWAFLVLGLL